MFSSRVRFYYCHFCLPLYFLGKANYIIFNELVLNLMTSGSTPFFFSETSNLLDNKRTYEIMTKAHNPYGDGKACERIINFMEGIK